MNGLTHLDLFSGIGGFALAARWAGFNTIGFSEIDPYASAVLKKHWPDVTNFGDIRKTDFSSIGDVRLLTGGYPCQPFSSAGQRRGAADDHHLWPAMFGVIEAVGPTWVVAENVAGHISMGLDEVLSDLENIGYAAQPIVIPACALGAWHRRDRVWIIAHTECGRRRKLMRADAIQGPLPATERAQGAFGAGSGCQDAADAKGERQSKSRQHIESMHSEKNESREADSLVSMCGPKQWHTEPNVGRVVDGVSTHMDCLNGISLLAKIQNPSTKRRSSGRSHRLKGLGNAIVPQVAFQILKTIAEIEMTNL